MPTWYQIVAGIGLFVAFYFALFSALTLLLATIAAVDVRDHAHSRRADLADEIFAFPLTPPISVLLPAYNESAAIVESVASLLGLRYPELEVIAINDGSKDDTLQQLVDAYGLEPLDRTFPVTLETQPIRGVYHSPAYPELIVIDKENGGKADSLNAGMNVSRYPLVCSIDADSILEADALLRAVEPMVLTPDLVIATGGIVRIANGSRFSRGTLVQAGLPRRFLPGFQIVEYLRGFLLGRSSWGHINALPIVSGAFGLFRKDVVVRAGGYAHTVGEDAELVVRMQRMLREEGTRHRLAFVPDAVCWTEAPESLRVLRRQRTRWQRGLYDTLARHKEMLFNPAYGALGMVALPYFLFFELLGPVMEGLAIPLAVYFWLAGVLNTTLVPWFLGVTFALGLVQSLAAMMLEDLAFRRYPRWRQMLALMGLAVIENVGYRQLVTIWRIHGIWQAMRGRSGWGTMTRTGAARGERVSLGGGSGYWALRRRIDEIEAADAQAAGRVHSALD